MPDIFDNKILCKNCEKAMNPALISKNGFNLRAVKCNDCGETLIHPNDKAEYENFMRLKQKEFNVKMRMVGNSYAVSIPREIVDFMREQESMMNNMVRMCFNELGSINLKFNTDGENSKSRVVQSKEIRVVKNGKQILHARKVFDSSNPKNNRIKVIKTEEEDND